jgi:transglutaminase-like putative cysteine protease
VLEFDMRPLQSLILCLCLLILVACQPGMNGELTQAPFASTSSAISILDSQTYQVQEHFRISNHGPGAPSKHDLWVALLSDQPPFQEVLERSINPQSYQVFSDEYGNQIAEFDLAGLPPGETLSVEISYRVKVNRVAYDLSDCQGDLPQIFTSPELHIESDNPQIKALSTDLARGYTTACERVRAFYDYVGNELVYSYNGNDWGAQAALGEMGADCTEYASLMIALSRAAGIPARYLEGVLYLSEATESLARREHAWLEVYLPEIGWTPMDPTMGRSSVSRQDYFAAYSPDHIIVSRGRNPSALRGASYYSHIYWPGNSASIEIEDFGWSITPSD